MKFNSSFMKLLKDFKYTEVKIHIIEGMTEDKLKYLNAHAEQARKFLNNGATFEQFAKCTATRVYELLTQADQLDSALNLITMNQIMGIDHAPKTPVFLNVDQNTVNFPVCSSEFMSVKITKDVVKISIEQNEKFNECWLSSKPLSEENKKIIESSIDTKLQENKNCGIHLINTWYRVTIKQPKIQAKTQYQNVLVYYCRELNEVLRVGYTGDFLINEILKNDISNSFRVLKEYNLHSFCKANNQELKNIKKMNGFTIEKLETMADCVRSLDIFTKHGITLLDFADIDASTIKFITEQIAHLAAALKFVNIYEIAGLQRNPVLEKKYDAANLTRDNNNNNNNTETVLDERKKNGAFKK